MTGDKQDTFSRLKSLIPRWFGDDTPILDALLGGLAYTTSFIHDLSSYARLQTRLKTATDGWLDMIAGDFFGERLQRKAGQSDDSFRNAIVINMFRERATRAGMSSVLAELTGTPPLITEPREDASLKHHQAVITIFRSDEQVRNPALFSDEDIAYAVDTVKPAATLMTIRIALGSMGCATRTAMITRTAQFAHISARPGATLMVADCRTRSAFAVRVAQHYSFTLLPPPTGVP